MGETGHLGGFSGVTLRDTCIPSPWIDMGRLQAAVLDLWFSLHPVNQMALLEVCTGTT